MANAKRILMIVTSHAELADTGSKTGFWLEELAAPYLAFVDGGANVDICSPKGGQPPADPKSESNPTAAVKTFLADPKATAKLASTIRIADVREPYDAYFVVGGHGVMWDLAVDADLQALLASAHASGKVIMARDAFSGRLEFDSRRSGATPERHWRSGRRGEIVSSR